MKLPVSTTLGFNPSTTKPLYFTNNTDLNLSNSNPINNHNRTNNNNNNNNLGYEPTSVLDLERSPSPVLTTENNHYHYHRPSTVDLDNLEGWDSILTELELNDHNNLPNPNNSKFLLSHITPDDLTYPFPTDFPSSQPLDHTPFLPPSDFPDLPYTPNFGPSDQHQQQNTTIFGVDFLDDLFRAAHAYESNDSHHLHVILSRLNQRLRCPVGKPLHRAAFYFKEALQHLSTNPTRPDKLSSYDVVQTIQATKAFSTLSPISLFSAFAANQAILEAVDGASFIHIVDFDVGFGGHWASFMRELVDKLGSIVLRITAIVPEEFTVESKLVRENLSQFATELNLNFHIDFVLKSTFEILSFKSIKFIDGEIIAVNLSPSVLHRYTRFVSDLRGVSPSLIVVVDREFGIEVGTASFGVNFIAGIEFYTGVLESLDAAAAGGFNGGGECVRKIEAFVVRPMIAAAVEAAARVVARWSMTWREAVVAAGMEVVGFSQFADFQAECLLRRTQVGGFHVAKRHGEMMLCWHDRSLVATSAWKF